MGVEGEVRVISLTLDGKDGYIFFKGLFQIYSELGLFALF